MLILLKISDASLIKTCFLLILINQSLGDDLYEGETCFTKSGNAGICTKITECKSIVNGLKSQIISFNSLTHCSFVGSIEVICCEDRKPTSSTRNTDITTSNPDQIVFIDNNGNVIPTEDLRNSGNRKPSTQKPQNNIRKASLACQQYTSLIRPSLTFHILDGEPALPGDFPHMAALGYPALAEGEDILWDCGGSLISDRYVLTAAHCVNRPERLPIIVRMGTVELTSKNSSFEFGIDDIILHPSYNPSRQYNDIALIKLNRTVNFGNELRPACLHTSMSDISTDKKLIATGWGSISTKTRQKSPNLLYTNLSPVNLSACNESHVSIGLNRRLPNGLNLGQLCAFDPELKKDACEGDSGGPLQFKYDKNCTIVGVTSFGIGCGSQIPGVYARVAFYLEWIENIVW